MHTILFDIDGTLLSTQNSGSSTIDKVLKDVFKIDRSMPLRLHGRTDRGILNELLLHHGLEANDENFAAFQNAYLPALDQFVQTYPSTILPGVIPLLEFLADRDDVALGVLTGNMQEGAKIKLKHSNLQKFFQFGGYGDRHPLRDDVARDARTAAEKHLNSKFRRDRLIVIGDTEADITCARSIHAKAIGVRTGGSDIDRLENQNPDHLLDDLSQAIPVFEKMLGR